MGSLGVYLGNESFIKKNWEGLFEKIKGRLEKWKWLLPQMSYRGHILVINNLVASSLWHKSACLDPPNVLLTNIQTELILGQLSLDSSKHAVFAQGGTRSRISKSHKQKSHLPSPVHTKTFNGTLLACMETIGIEHLEKSG